jgi:DNA-directed RNA polymerase subunit RPC12/RpoP
MAYKCLSCGHIFEDGEQARWEEHRPYGMGYATESFDGCPICQGDFEEAKQCKICGGEFLEDELKGGCVCDDCLQEMSKDLSVCYEIGKQDRQETKINGMLLSILSVEEIEQILYDFIKENKKGINCSAYIKQDEDWFADKLSEEVSK